MTKKEFTKMLLLCNIDKASIKNNTFEIDNFKTFIFENGEKVIKIPIFYCKLKEILSKKNTIKNIVNNQSNHIEITGEPKKYNIQNGKVAIICDKYIFVAKLENIDLIEVISKNYKRDINYEIPFTQTPKYIIKNNIIISDTM